MLICFQKNNSPKFRRIKLLGALGILAVLVGPRFIHPDQIDIPTCLFHYTTGLSCPGCGLTRSFYAMGHFQVNDAFAYHLFGPLTYLFLISLFGKFLFEGMSHLELKLNISEKPKLILLWSTIGVWLLYWIGRMVSELIF